ncbi:hypothetical protein DLM76_14870 [Leptospira yasudae]|uniref:hypothetical protein n=1 Tax=Leptospira yasudae TaxID=2202201 RepID=UPI000E59A5D7|nr:hypothetical protein [Leptospira yasudae]RHX93359.1 hypothetical protein DLM76_14870 [Leptospira yasudae]TGK24719.1 hypothetical protein EHQ05_17640 [Leptospira yasudae]TGM09396.1 hypothetical protein EHQ86_01835 [Leptospira yasudae]
MKKLFSILISLLLLSTVFVGCNSRKDETTDKAIFNYILACGPGGTIESCNAGCAATYGNTVTTTNLQSLNTCTSSCSTNCNVLTLYLQYSSLNK